MYIYIRASYPKVFWNMKNLFSGRLNMLGICVELNGEGMDFCNIILQHQLPILYDVIFCIIYIIT